MPPKKVENKIAAIDDQINSASADKSSYKKTRLLNEIKEGLREVKRIRGGETKSHSMADLFGRKA